MYFRADSSRRRREAFAASLLCMLCAGTLYLFSGYAQGLGLSQTMLNVVASCGGLGQYLSGPLWGKLSDLHDRRAVGSAGGALLFVGYGMLARGSSNVSADADAPAFLLAVAYFLVGFGSAALANAAMASSVKNHPPSHVGFAVGVPVAFIGISAFVFSATTAFFVDERGLNVPAFLTFMAVATGIGAIAASRFLHDCSAELIEGNIADPVNDPETSSLLLMQPPLPESATRISLAQVGPTLEGAPGQTASVAALFAQRDACLLFFAFTILSGAGLMYINNVGAVVAALSPPEKSTPADIQAARSVQVALLSLCSCIARVTAGLVSDRLSAKYGVSRLAALGAGAGLIASAMLLGGGSSASVRALSGVTILLGLGYGGMFSAAPAIVRSWFGVDGFGLHWGLFQVAPAVGGQVLNLVFGILLDAASSSSGGKNGECAGRRCFALAFGFAFVACCGALAVLVYLNAMRRARSLAD
ncbi:hypothetical protein HDU83_005670 [Entophlyctis luteolus]|nr:hypothetical protein HDU82_002854 [Entophlyctis luteolus]KAJ3343437.1 hypothetical protein HDU83_005670 [Entophlyctis luteolus]